jgi:hypothetical protein
MRVRHWLVRIALALAAALLLLTAYGYYATREQPVAIRKLTVRGQTTAPPGLEGRVTVRVFQAWAGRGVLRHPLESVAQFQAPLGAFQQVIDYPLNDGEGLIVYAWLDVDGDGVHCTPSARHEPAGLVVVQGFPANPVSVNVDMNMPCAGPEFFYPR